jgi:hypothetical protein
MRRGDVATAWPTISTPWHHAYSLTDNRMDAQWWSDQKLQPSWLGAMVVRYRGRVGAAVLRAREVIMTRLRRVAAEVMEADTQTGKYRTVGAGENASDTLDATPNRDIAEDG